VHEFFGYYTFVVPLGVVWAEKTSHRIAYSLKRYNEKNRGTFPGKEKDSGTSP
jgi:hypothetical protein